MRSYNIVYKKYGKYSAIIYSVSYLSPLEEISQISKDLKKKLKNGDYVLLDLLLSNGDNFNRFAEFCYDGSDIKVSEISLTDVSGDELKALNQYYKGRVKELNNSVLSPKERFVYATMK